MDTAIGSLVGAIVVLAGLFIREIVRLRERVTRLEAQKNGAAPPQRDRP